MSHRRRPGRARAASPCREAGRQALGQGDHRQVGVGRGHARHHRGVHQPEPLQPAHPPVDHRLGVVGAAHAAAADRVVEGLDGAQHVVGVAQAGPGCQHLGQLRPGGHLQQPPPGGHGGGAVAGLEEPAHVDHRLGGRVAALQAHDAPARAGVGDLDVEVGEALAALDRARVGQHLVDAPLAADLVLAGQQALVYQGLGQGGAGRASSKR
jgi:hypothetical protein